VKISRSKPFEVTSTALAALKLDVIARVDPTRHVVYSHIAILSSRASLCQFLLSFYFNCCHHCTDHDSRGFAAMPLLSQAAHTMPTVSKTAISVNAQKSPNVHNRNDINTLDLTGPSTEHSQDENTAPQPRTGTKRKSTSNDNEDENDVHLSDIDVSGELMTENPDQVRRKISRLIENGGMKVGEFCDTIKVSQNAFRRFVQQSGKTKGVQSDVYVAAAIYFRQRKVAGLKLPTAASKKAKTTSQASPGASASTGASNGGGGGGGGAPDGPGDFREIELPGEATDSVPVYDTCADVRRKISAYLREPKNTQAQFCRDLYAQLHGPEKGKSLQSAQLQRFRGGSGANEGGDSKVFYAGYVFFEKKRLAENKPKSKKRQDMENVWPNGVDRSTFGRLRYVLFRFFYLCSSCSGLTRGQIGHCRQPKRAFLTRTPQRVVFCWRDAGHQQVRRPPCYAQIRMMDSRDGLISPFESPVLRIVWLDEG
jgi:hypothetical protein